MLPFGSMKAQATGALFGALRQCGPRLHVIPLYADEITLQLCQVLGEDPVYLQKKNRAGLQVGLCRTAGRVLLESLGKQLAGGPEDHTKVRILTASHGFWNPPCFWP